MPKRYMPRYWSCPFCGTFNPKDYEHCSRCEGPKPERWICPECQFPNDTKDEKCFICGERLREWLKELAVYRRRKVRYGNKRH